MKKLFKVLLWILGVVVALVVTLPLWISPVGRVAANIAVPKITGSAFHLDGLNLSLDWFSLATDTIVVKDITISGLYYEQNISFSSLFPSGEGTSVRTADTTKEPKAKAAKKTEYKNDPKAKEGASKKVIIDHLLVENVTVAINGVAVPVPRIELRDIGRKSGGTTWAEAWDEVSAQVLNQAGKISDMGIEQAGKMTKKLKEIKKDIKGIQADKAVDAIKGLFK